MLCYSPYIIVLILIYQGSSQFSFFTLVMLCYVILSSSQYNYFNKLNNNYNYNKLKLLSKVNIIEIPSSSSWETIVTKLQFVLVDKTTYRLNNVQDQKSNHLKCLLKNHTLSQHQTKHASFPFLHLFHCANHKEKWKGCSCCWCFYVRQGSRRRVA